MDNKVLNFHIYRYHLLPIDNAGGQVNMFADEKISRDELKERKNEFMGAVLSKLVDSKSNKNPLKLEESEGDYYLFKLAQKKSTKITQNFTNKNIPDEPYVYVIFNNHQGVQKIAISENSDAFSSTMVVRNILRKVFRKDLKLYRLNIEIEALYSKVEFWKYVSEHSKEITYLNFEFIKPNLADISKTLPRDFKKFADATNSHESHIVLKAPEKGTLDKINEDNEVIKGLVDYTSEGAGSIKLKVKSIRKQLNTKENPTIIEINELDIEGTADQVIKLYKTIVD
jgi:hypothetical protein